MKARQSVVLVLSMGALLVAAGSAAAATPVPVNGGWINFGIPGLGPVTGNPFTFTSTKPMILKVTDLGCFGNEFSLTDGNKKLGASSPVSTQNCGPGANQISDPDVAYADKRYSHGTWTLLPGPHSISIVSTVFPFSSGSGGDLRVDTLKK